MDSYTLQSWTLLRFYQVSAFLAQEEGELKADCYSSPLDETDSSLGVVGKLTTVTSVTFVAAKSGLTHAKQWNWNRSR